MDILTVGLPQFANLDALVIPVVSSRNFQHTRRKAGLLDKNIVKNGTCRGVRDFSCEMLFCKESKDSFVVFQCKKKKQ
jgi:hypothetical protein